MEYERADGLTRNERERDLLLDRAREAEGKQIQRWGPVLAGLVRVKLLVLDGTEFVGRAVVENTLARGRDVDARDLAAWTLGAAEKGWGIRATW